MASTKTPRRQKTAETKEPRMAAATKVARGSKTAARTAAAKAAPAKAAKRAAAAGAAGAGASAAKSAARRAAPSRRAAAPDRRSAESGSLPDAMRAAVSAAMPGVSAEAVAQSLPGRMTEAMAEAMNAAASSFEASQTSSLPAAMVNAMAGVLPGAGLLSAPGGAGGFGSLAPLDFKRLASTLPSPWTIDQTQLSALQGEFTRQAGDLWKEMVSGAAPQLKDRRFGDKAWKEQPQYGWQAAWYLLNADYLRRMSELIDSDAKTQDRIRFFTEQFIDAMSPANFFATNPEAQAELIESGGESLRKGIDNLLGDLKRGNISQTDLTAFEVGRNVGTSSGRVVYENELIQLIQYDPTTDRVGKRPLLIVPPCINKFYILDLQPENSFIGYAVSQGHTVFVVSWRNVKAAQGHLTWDDYLQMGVVDAIEVARDICDVETINALGFCVGGTILSTTLAALAARGERPVESLTLLTTLLDFENPGILGVFIDEMQVAMREAQMGSGGLLSGKDLATTFSFLRPNDLVWNYVVANYLKGKSPPAFDLLFWNADSTNLAGPMYCWYLRHMYLQNELREPGKITSLGEPVDLTAIELPTYVFSAREDHIVPWQAAFQSARLLHNEPRFIVGASGHIAGVINPASKNKRSFWVGPDIDGFDSSEAWFSAAEEKPGSWWSDWAAWLDNHRGGVVDARRELGNGQHRPTEPAPGRFVKERAE